MSEEKDIKLPDAAKTIELIDEVKEQPKKRGPYKTREKSDTPKRTGKKERLSARQLTGMLFLGHSAAANMTGIKEVEITESEAEQISSALVDVLQFYDFEASAKTVAWCNLIGTCATIYGVKAWAFLQHKQGNQNEQNF